VRKKYLTLTTCPICKQDRFVAGAAGEMCVSCRRAVDQKRMNKRMIGKKFGKLLVLEYVETKCGKPIWRCRCDCGNEKNIRGSCLRRGHTTTCGCLNKSLNGTSNTRSYKSYESMLRRCYKKTDKRYGRYGGRGITVCDRWRESYLNFFDDMGDAPDKKSIDRIDNNKGYYKENCRWATRKEQFRNRSTNKFITAFGKKQTHSEWAKERKIGRSTLEWRIYNGWSPEDALTLPINRKPKEKK